MSFLILSMHHMSLIEENIIMAPFTTLGVGGPARYFARASSVEDIKDIVKFAKRKKTPLIPIGGGSNILVSDEGVQGMVVKMEIPGISFNNEEKDSILMKVFAGEDWDKVVERSVSAGLYGLENLSGIPGTAGAAPVQNIGAYGVEISGLVFEVEVYDAKEEKFTVFKNEECSFGYRESIFKNSPGRFLITSVIMKLSKRPYFVSDYKDISERMSSGNYSQDGAGMREMVLDIRSKKFPDEEGTGSVGSFFKNPVLSSDDLQKVKMKFPDIPFYPHGSGYFKVPLAWILDKLLKVRGLRHGNVGLFDSQPLVLVAYNGATQKEIFAFAEEIKKGVKDATGIEVDYEVKLLS